eukprot:TRINITY_DN3785_c0_g1_i1.p1 TRINITY_DN3785_c0_g1~~TRINITY_DN3785_c0_g1_i1.p1  ORF type:complete len:360 (+),score=53.77 TRINITY_DN3785_c0_g1_i1:163-1080(+)
MEHIARNLASQPQFRLGEIEWKTFPDGFPNLFVKNAQQLRERHVIFLASFFYVEQIFAQLSIIHALPRYDVRSMTIVLPYFPTGTMERVDIEGQIATAMTLARMISNTPLTSSGPSKLVIFDIHSLQERFYFGNKVIPILESGIPLLLKELEKRSTSEGHQISIAFPDEGAKKRFWRYFEKYEVILCSKVRDGDKRVVKIAEGDVKDRHIVIVDDLVQTGGTLLECSHALKVAGALSVSAYVTHAIFPNNSWKKFLPDPSEGKESFHTFYTTDSCPTAKILEDKKPFHILSLGPLLYDYFLNKTV